MTFTVILWIVGLTGFGIGWVLAVVMVADKYRQRAEQWKRTAHELDRRWAEAEAELTKALAANQKLHDEIAKVYDAGIVAGQTFHQDREANGL